MIVSDGQSNIIKNFVSDNLVYIRDEIRCLKDVFFVSVYKEIQARYCKRVHRCDDSLQGRRRSPTDGEDLSIVDKQTVSTIIYSATSM